MKYLIFSFLLLSSCAVKTPSDTDTNQNEKKELQSSDSDYSNIQELGRKIVKRNTKGILDIIDLRSTSNSKIVSKLCINPKGEVSYVELIENETTTQLSHSQKKEVLRALHSYKYESKEDAPFEECGKLTVKFN